MSLREIRRDENGNLQRIYEPRYEYDQQFERYNFLVILAIWSSFRIIQLSRTNNLYFPIGFVKLFLFAGPLFLKELLEY